MWDERMDGERSITASGSSTKHTARCEVSVGHSSYCYDRIVCIKIIMPNMEMYYFPPSSSSYNERTEFLSLSPYL